MNQIFLKHINKYHPINWLFKSIERSRNVDRSKIDKQENLYGSTEFLIIMSDIALRVSQNRNLTTTIPTHKEYVDFINIYINTQSKGHSPLIQKYGISALSLLVSEQVKFMYPNINLIGRLLVLYSNYEKEIFQITGLKINDILTLLIAIMAFYSKSENYIFEIKNLNIESVKSLEIENITNFLKYFSIDKQNYNLKLKKMGLNKRELYSFRLLERFPIINFEKNKYIVPSIENLLYSITSNMHIHLLEYMSKEGKGSEHHNSLGAKFEEYVRLLTSKKFDDMVEAKDIVPPKSANAEFVVDFNDTAIVVEVKKMAFLRDTAFKDNLDDLDTLLKRHILKAFKQIETTFKSVTQTNKIGIIVIFGDIHLVAGFIYDYMRKTYPDEGIEFLENIIIMPIGEYEALLANSDGEIINILNYYLGQELKDKGSILLTIESLQKNIYNEFLEEKFNNYSSVRRS